MSVWSLLQLDTVEGMVFSLFPLRFSSSSCSSLLSLLEEHQDITVLTGMAFITTLNIKSYTIKAADGLVTHLAGKESNWL